MVKTQVLFNGKPYAEPREWRDEIDAKHYVRAYHKAGQDPRYVAVIVEEECSKRAI
jgi:hypothetical protein